MNAGGIDINRIQAMVQQLKTASTRPQTVANPVAEGVSGVASSTGKVDFADALKATLDQVNTMQVKANEQGQRFSMGDDSVNLSDVMISQQKASIAFQATVQVRNKLVSAYHDIMAMQV